MVSERNFHTIKLFLEDLLVIETKKVQIFRNKSFYSGLSILEISKIVMHEFGMITRNKNMEKKRNYVTWIQTAL